MSSFSIGSIESKNLIASDKAFLIAMQVEVKDIDNPAIIEVLHLVSNNEDIVLGGVNYTAFPFQVEFKYEAGTQADITVTAKDVTRVLQSRMQTYNGAVGFNVRLMIYHQDDFTGKPEFEEYFQVVSATSSDYIVTWRLGAENLLDRRIPGRIQYKDRCSWAYKSEECGYLGAKTSCDYTLVGPNGCQAHNNARRFGGFPGIGGG